MSESTNTSSQTPNSDQGNPGGSELQSRDVEATEVDKSQNAGSSLEQISALLRDGLDPSESESDDTNDRNNSDDFNRDSDNKNSDTRKAFEKPPETLAELAEGTGLSIDDLYKLAIPDGQEEGKTHTLGELKDAASKLNGFELRELELDQEHSERTAKLNRMQAEIEDLFNLIPKEFRTKELVEQVSSRRDGLIMREREKALNAIKPWKDETTRNMELNAMAEHLGDYGIPAEYLTSLADHRLFVYIRENWKRDERVKATLATVREKFPKKPDSKPAPKGRTTAVNRSSNNRMNQQVSQIADLLRNGE